MFDYFLIKHRFGSVIIFLINIGLNLSLCFDQTKIYIFNCILIKHKFEFVVIFLLNIGLDL